MSMDNKKPLDVFIDGLGNGGAENLLSQLLPLFKPHFSSISIHCFKGDYFLEPKFQRNFSIFKHSSIGLLRKIFTSSTISYFHLGRCTLYAFFILAIRANLRSKKNFIVHLHTTLQFHHLKQKSLYKKIIDMIYLFFLRYVLKKKLCKVIVSSDDHLREINIFLGRELIVGTDVFILPNSFTNEYIQKLKQTRMSLNSRRPLIDKEITFFTLSRLDPLKQLDWAIYAAYEAAKNFSNINFILNIFGKGPDKERLQKVINNLAARTNFKCQLCGFAENIFQPLSTSDIYLFPSKIEGSPLTLAEAALSGICCIANDCHNGPKYLSTFFQNISLSSPPTQKNFITKTSDIVETLLINSDPDYLQINNSPSKKPNMWLSLESMVDGLAVFFNKVPNTNY